MLLLAEGKTSEAIDEAERRLSEEPQPFETEALSMAVEAWLHAGNCDQARQHLEKLQRIAPEDWDMLGLTSNGRGRGSNGKAWRRRFLDRLTGARDPWP